MTPDTTHSETAHQTPAKKDNAPAAEASSPVSVEEWSEETGDVLQLQDISAVRDWSKLVAIAKDEAQAIGKRIYALELLPMLFSGTWVAISPLLRGLSRFSREAEVRQYAIKALGRGITVSPADVVAVFAALDDPEEQVRQASRQAIERWATSTSQPAGGTMAMIAGLLTAAGAVTLDVGRFCLQNSLIRIIILPMSGNPDREQRINTVAAHIRDVAAELPDPDEQREAEAKALVTSVPSEDAYPEQVKAFTGITHVMRTLMARQLEPKFRDHLRNHTQRELQESEVSPESLASRKVEFAAAATNSLFRLGLGIGWKDKICHLSSNRTKKVPKGEFRVIPCRETEPVACPGKWTENYLNKVFLVDAAPPLGENTLSPVRRK